MDNPLSSVHTGPFSPQAYPENVRLDAAGEKGDGIGDAFSPVCSTCNEENAGVTLPDSHYSIQNVFFIFAIRLTTCTCETDLLFDI